MRQDSKGNVVMWEGKPWDGVDPAYLLTSDGEEFYGVGLLEITLPPVITKEMAAVTFGNAKKADVIAVEGDRATSLEVKTTFESKWVLGGAVPEDTSSLWVLVHLPTVDTESPEYFILTGERKATRCSPRQFELHEAQQRLFLRPRSVENDEHPKLEYS